MAKKKPKEIVVVGSKVKEVIKKAGLRSDGELVQAVSDKVHDLLAAIHTTKLITVNSAPATIIEMPGPSLPGSSTATVGCLGL